MKSTSLDIVVHPKPPINAISIDVSPLDGLPKVKEQDKVSTFLESKIYMLFYILLSTAYFLDVLIGLFLIEHSFTNHGPDAFK